MKICKTSIEKLEHARKYRQVNKAKIAERAKQRRWEHEHLTHSQRENLTLSERKKLYQNRK